MSSYFLAPWLEIAKHFKFFSENRHHICLYYPSIGINRFATLSGCKLFRIKLINYCLNTICSINGNIVKLVHNSQNLIQFLAFYSNLKKISSMACTYNLSLPNAPTGLFWPESFPTVPHLISSYSNTKVSHKIHLYIAPPGCTCYYNDCSCMSVNGFWW